MVSQKQSAGHGSINVQAESVVLNHGLSVADVRELVRMEVRPLFEEMSANARDLAQARAADIADELVTRLAAENAEALRAANDPDFQHALITAQREYARSGNADLRDLLVAVLIERASQDQGTLLRIVLNEALVVAPKLTSQQLSGLTAMFVVGSVRSRSLSSHAALADWMDGNVGPFCEDLPRGQAWFQHLQYAGCLQSVGFQINSLPLILRNRYPGMFVNGFDRSEVADLIDEIPTLETMLIPCLNDASKLQLAALDAEVLMSRASVAGLSDEQRGRIESALLARNPLSDDEAIEAIRLGGWRGVDALADWWRELPGFGLTSIGITLAHSNWTRVTGSRAELEIWIN